MLAPGRPQVEKLLDLDVLLDALRAAHARLEPRSRNGAVVLGEIIGARPVAGRSNWRRFAYEPN